MKMTKHKHCICCRRVRIKQTVNRNGVCQACLPHKNPNYFIKENALPVWYKGCKIDSEPNFHVPSELQGLTITEKLLIQRVSPFVPLEHIKNGTFGLRGHVCAFEQDIQEFTTRLPKAPDDIEILRIQQTIRAEIGSEVFHRKSFLVRRSKVLAALRWLKQNNIHYRDIIIDESQLDWIGKSDGAFFQPKTVVVEDSDANTGLEEDLGPVPINGQIPKPAGDEIVATGLMESGNIGTLSEMDQTINDSLQRCVNESPNKKQINLCWPSISEKPVNEFGDKRIFALAFPWLFPGGFGDPKDFPRSLGQWGSMMLFYEDARFATDKIFCFFALNYITRHRNASSGRFFIENFPHGSPDTLEELQEEVKNGNTRFVNNLTYFNRRVHGSDAYWRHKRSEVYSWINHHVEVGNGAPMFFITLSCAEYFWADVVDLLRDRLQIAGLDPSQCKIGGPGFVQMVNDYSIVIQEYFQERVVEWLDSVGKSIFGIKHYWIRYEFAPGRGQIHAHLLAISEDQEVYKIAHDIYRHGGGSSDSPEADRAKLLANFAKEKFDLRASVDDDFDGIAEEEYQPCSIRFTDVCTSEEEQRKDGQCLLKAVQMHECNKFCLKPGKSKR